MIYSVYGLRLASVLPLAGALPVDGQTADVTFTMEPFTGSGSDARTSHETPWYHSAWTDQATGAPGLTIYRSAREGAFHIVYGDGVEFLIDGDGRRIVGRAPSAASLADVACYLTGPVLGFVLRLRGIVAFHASAIEAGGRAFLFVGDARAGKSTTAAMLAREGHRVLTEDVAALSLENETVAVRAGCAEVALRPDAVELMYGSPEALPKFSETWDKHRLDLTASGAFSTAAVPLGGVYLLANTEGIPGAPCVAPISAGEAMVELLANVYGNRLFHHELRLRELDTVHRVVSSVPVKIAATGAEPRTLERFCRVLLDDLA